jgi:hypothetical protein
MPNCVILKNDLVALTTKEFYFDEFKSERLHKKHAVATCNLGTSFRICLRTCRQARILLYNRRSDREREGSGSRVSGARLRIEASRLGSPPSLTSLN